VRRGTSFTPDGPLTLGDLADMVSECADQPRTALVEIRTPMVDRKRVTLTVLAELADGEIYASDVCLVCNGHVVLDADGLHTHAEPLPENVIPHDPRVKVQPAQKEN
jgi:hypothetical protein